MQVSIRCWLGIVSVVGLSLVLVACGEDKKEPVPVEPAAADEAEKSAGAEAPAPSAYVIPEALSYKQSRAEYGRGKMRAAKKKNTEALKLRKKKDSEGAIASYKEALELSPGYVTARFNLACEYARFGKADGAIGELEHLFRMGTPKAMRKIAKLQVDSDFDPIREDSRIKDIVKSFAVDFDEPFFKQICGNEGKILTVMDAKEGLYGISARMDSRGGAIRGKATLVKGGKARTKVFNTLNMVCGDGKIIRDERSEALVLSDTKLSKWTEKYVKRCVNYSGNVVSESDGDQHGTDVEGTLCFIRQGQGWMLGVVGEWPVAEMESNVESVVKKAVKKAVKAWGS